MRRRALLAGLGAAILGLVTGSGRHHVDQPPVVHAGPPRETPWYPGKPRSKPPDFIYENGLTDHEHGVAVRTPCACSKPQPWEIRYVPSVARPRRRR